MGPVRRALRRRRARRRRVPVGHPGLGRRDADPERRRLRPGGRRDDRLGARVRPRARARGRARRRRLRVHVPLERVQARRRAAGSCSRSRSRCRAGRLASRSATPSWRARSGSPRARPRRSPTCATAVLALRRGKGMVIDPADPDSVSAGSFFTNPVLDAGAFAALEARARERLGDDVRVPRFPQPDGSVKTSAAWLIERAGFARGHGDPATVAISGKHTLALTNRGAGTTAQLVALAREIAAGVRRGVRRRAGARAGLRRTCLVLPHRSRAVRRLVGPAPRLGDARKRSDPDGRAVRRGLVGPSPRLGDARKRTDHTADVG